MGFRTVVVKHRCKLDVKLNYMVCRGDVETRIFLPEISTLILESTAISLTTALISELTKSGAKIVFCDEKHNPENELVPYHAHYSSFKKIQEQLKWSPKTKQKIWSKIIKEKINNQKKILQKYGFKDDAKLLEKYMHNVNLNDASNREGFAAKVYFNALFGQDFARRSASFVNGALNYGYAVILACFNREIVKNGYLTQLGIWHKNEFNYFNLSSDLMEPFRTLIDAIVLEMPDTEQRFKFKILEVLEQKVKIGGKEQLLENAIAVYCRSVFDALNKNNEQLIMFYEP